MIKYFGNQNGTKQTFYSNIYKVLLILLLTGCDLMFKPLVLDVEVPDGPPEYRAGWRDGCSSGLSAGAFVAGKMHDFSFGSGIYQHDPAYQSAWSSGWFACIISAGVYTGSPGLSTGPLD